MRYFDDYKAARIPTFPSTYGSAMTRLTIAVSSLIAALSIGSAGVLIGVEWGFLRVLAVLTGAMLVLSI